MKFDNRFAIAVAIPCILALLPFPQSPEIADAADRYLSIRAEMGNFSGAVLIAKDGKISRG